MFRYKQMLDNYMASLKAWWTDGRTFEECVKDFKFAQNCFIGEVLFALKVQAGYSTGEFCNRTTCGYGKLDFHGYWQFPVRSEEQKMHDESLEEIRKKGASD